MDKEEKLMEPEWLQEAVDKAAAEVTRDWLHPKLREAGVENPERYVVSYVRDAPEPVQGFAVTLSPEDEASRDRVMRFLAEMYVIPEVANEP
jgi:hypothetical protein